jgi:hypothetical protein
MPKRLSHTTTRVLAWSGEILFYGGWAGVFLSLFFVDGLARLSDKTGINVVYIAWDSAWVSLAIGYGFRLVTERFGATYQGSVAVLRMFGGSFAAIIGVFLMANGIQHLGGSARPNAFGQECWDATCYHAEWIALGAIALGGAFFLFRSQPDEPLD